MTADHQSRDWLLLLPLLCLYVAVVLLGSPSSFAGDEGRYVQFAENLTRGFYVPPGTVSLPSGPGYPLLLAPLALLGVPWDLGRLLNAALLFLGILYLHAALRLYLPHRRALWVAGLIGIYPPALRGLPCLLTETLAVLLVCAAAYHFVNYCRGRAAVRSWHLAASGAWLGWLALTKVFFGYIVLVALLISAVAAAVRRTPLSSRACLTCALGLLLCVPYLAYTCKLTGKVFYWSSIGGASLYWMATPYPGELGDWQGNTLAQVEERDGLGEERALVRNHGPFFSSLVDLDDVQRDQALRQQGLRNVRNHPGKFAENWAANVGRLLFSYPNSFTPQKLSTYFYLLPNMLILGMALLCGYASALRPRRIPGEISVLLAFGLLSFLGSSLLSAYPRHFVPLFPIFAVWMAVVLERTLGSPSASSRLAGHPGQQSISER